MTRRVVVTGISVVTALGQETGEFWERLCAGKSGISKIQRFDTTEFKVTFGGEIKEFDPTDLIPGREAKKMDRFVQFAVYGGIKAVKQSGIDFSQGDPYRYGVMTGSGIGGLHEIEEQHCVLFDRGPNRVSPFLIPKMMINAASGNLSVFFGLKGPNSAVATACASASNAIGDAFRWIQHGQADVCLVGGSESAMTPMGLAGFARMSALSTRNDDPTRASRPFDKDRDGFVIAEGAGMAILEEYEHAKKRGATILAELIGYGMSSDGSHMTSPDPEGRGAGRAMQNALADARLDPSRVQYINAHGTSTPQGDKAETCAIKSVFGPLAKKVAVSSTKSQLGHLLGASGGVEFVISVLALLNQVAPPTINLENPDPDCDLDYIPHQARPMRLDYIMSNSFGFGGHNASLVLAKAP